LATAPVLETTGLRAVAKPAPVPRKLDSILLYGLSSVLLFGPLAFGAVEYWSVFVLEISATVLFAIWVVKETQSRDFRFTRNALFPPMLAFAALIGIQLVTGRSAYPAESESQGLLYCAYGALSFLAVQCVRRTAQANILARIFAGYGSAVALFALLQGTIPNGKLYWLRTPQLGGWIYGPYVNHNHYAGLMEMLVPIPLVFCLTRHAYGTRKWAAAFAATLMAATIFASGSRGGMLALTAEIVFLVLVDRARKQSWKPTLVLGAFLLLVLGIAVWLGGGEITKRLASIHSESRAELSGGMRLSIDRDGLRMFMRKPVLGWGLGSFPVVYPEFRTFYTNFYIDHAHNDYLQLLVETGSCGFAIMLWFLVLLYRNSLKRIRDWTTSPNGAVSLAALLGCTGVLVHSFVDFNLHIPANAALFFVLCAVAAAEPFHDLHKRKRVYVPEPAEAWVSLEPKEANSL
jgi:O-antigen ligase